nr:proteasome subunit alpha type-3 [Seculamonas ecuadoriensis]
MSAGYDLSVTTYSPEGRVFQVEYAGKAIDNSGTVVGLRCKDGVVLGVEKFVISKMIVEGSNRRVFNVDRHVGLAAAGLAPDARQVVARARAEASNYRSHFKDDIPGRVLAERLASFLHVSTWYWALRPFGCAVLLATHDVRKGHALFLVEPSGVMNGYYGCATGKGKQGAKTEIEKLNLSELTCREAVNEIAKIIYRVHDEKDKDFELELSWLCEENNWVHSLVPEDLRLAAVEAAKAALAEADESDDEDGAGDAPMQQ